jgi:hypothetical protein
MSSFFSSGRVDTSRVNRDKLPAGNNGNQAVYRVRVTDICDHFGANGGDRTQVDLVVTAGPLAGRTAAELIMHSGYSKAWMAEKARGTIATVVGAFAGFSRDKAGFRVDNEFFSANSRNVSYAGNTIANSSREKSELPLVQSGAEAFLVVSPYFDKRTGLRKSNPKTGQKSVTYEFFPLSANLQISTTFEGSEPSDDETPPAPVEEESEEPAVDALALAVQAGWKPNPNAPGYFYLKGTKEQLKEAALRAKFGG